MFAYCCVESSFKTGRLGNKILPILCLGFFLAIRVFFLFFIAECSFSDLVSHRKVLWDWIICYIMETELEKKLKEHINFLYSRTLGAQYCIVHPVSKNFASLASANARVHNERNFPQVKLDSKINVPFLFNEHGHLYFLSHSNSVHILLNRKKKRRIVEVKKRYRWKPCKKPYSGMQTMTAKTTAFRTL